MIRRLLFAITIVVLTEHTAFQLQINLLFSMFYLPFLIHVKPMFDPSLNRLEILNEITLLTCYLICFTYTDFTDDIDIRE